MRKALERIEESFRSQEMIDAIETLADKLPALAEGVAKMVDFAVDSPFTAGAMALGARPGLNLAKNKLGTALICGLSACPPLGSARVTIHP